MIWPPPDVLKQCPLCGSKSIESFRFDGIQYHGSGNSTCDICEGDWDHHCYQCRECQTLVRMNTISVDMIRRKAKKLERENRRIELEQERNRKQVSEVSTQGLFDGDDRRVK